MEHKGSLFISNLLTLPNISAIVKGKRKSSVSAGDDPLPDVLVALNPVSRALEINSKLEHVSQVTQLLLELCTVELLNKGHSHTQ